MNLKPQLLLVLVVLVIHVAAADLSDDALADQLYGRIEDGQYQEAVTKTFELENNDKGAIITNIVNRLLANSHRNSMEYAYKLWQSNVDIVKQYFPIEFQIVFDQDHLKLINIRDCKYAIKLWRTYGMNDTNDKTGDKMSWQVFADWEDDKIYFKIWNTRYGQYLKLEHAADDVAEHRDKGPDKFTSRKHQWYLQPVKCNKDVLFFIINREFGKALFLGRYIHRDADRLLKGYDVGVKHKPKRYGWFD